EPHSHRALQGSAPRSGEQAYTTLVRRSITRPGAEVARMATKETTTVERVSLPLYTFADTDRLAHVSGGTAKRWLRGYRYKSSEGRPTAQPPVTPGFADGEAASFTDLVEIVAIGGLKGLGFSLQEIRDFVRNCQDFLGVDRPLTKLKFQNRRSRVLRRSRPDAPGSRATQEKPGVE
ncbi:MAG: hypothetical protein HW416_3520, partial [Chloroflexi bacterium]|nr:hypothetical protein [Chloroflexota bacterium]